MKRIISTLFCLLITLTSFAQSSSEHLKFMGVPITGTITQFQSKLTQKGCTYDKDSAKLSAGRRAFNGTFAGNKVWIGVYYDTKTKIVYRVKAIIEHNSEKIAEQRYAKMLDLFKQKYDTSDFSYDTQDGKDALSIYLSNGTIDMFFVKNDYDDYDVHIDYWDYLNNKKFNKSNLDDI